MDNLKEKGIKAFIWDFFGKMASHGMGFIVSIFLARLLEPSDFGLIAMVMVFIGMANVFTDVGLGSALVQRRRLRSIHYSSVFYFNIIAGLFLTCITYFSASWISDFYQHEQLIALIQVMSFFFIISAFSSVQTTLLHKELNYTLLTKIRMISALISGVIGIFLAFSGAGVWSLVAQTLLNGVAYNTFIWLFAKWKPSFEFSWRALIQLWGFGFRMYLAGMLEAIFTRLDFLIIGKLFEPATLGFFQRAKSLNEMVTRYSSGSLMTVLFPVLSKVQQDLPRLQNIVMKLLGVICFVVFLLVGALFLVSKELIVLVFSDKWLPTVDFFKILVLSGFGYPIGALLVNIISSRGNSKGFLRLEIYKKILMVINFVVLYYFGIVAYLYGLIITTVFSVLLNILFASRETKLPFYVFVKPIITQMFIAVITVTMTGFITRNIELMDVFLLLVNGSIFTVLYFLLNYLFATSSYCYFLEQTMVLIRHKQGK